MLFYSNDGAIFDVLFFYTSGLQLSYVVFLSEEMVPFSVCFFVFFRKVIFFSPRGGVGGVYTFRSSTLLDCVF